MHKKVACFFDLNVTLIKVTNVGGNMSTTLNSSLRISSELSGYSFILERETFSNMILLLISFRVNDWVVVEKSKHSRNLLETILKQCIS